MRQQRFDFILEAHGEPVMRLDTEREQELVRLMAALLIAVFGAGEEATDGESAETN